MHSQNNEEQIILEYFKDHIGVFLDIGANDGITLSNTRRLAKMGWSGVCVEPSPTVFNKLSKLYEDNQNIQCVPFAISNSSGKCTFYESNEHLGNGDYSLLSTLIESEIDRWKGTQTFTKIEVDTITIDRLFEISNFKKFDFISIDCEGLDYEILKNIKPYISETKMICVEWNSIGLDKYTSLLSNHRLHSKNYENLIFTLNQ
jgi:FkbM family methyltransferase